MAAAPLPQFTPDLQPELVSGVQPPAQPANPPTPADVEGAMKLMAELRLHMAIPDAVVDAVTLYSADVIASSQLALIASAPGPTAIAHPAGPPHRRVQPWSSMRLQLSIVGWIASKGRQQLMVTWERVQGFRYPIQRCCFWTDPCPQ
ncbi:hypothetical protein GALMADRAFT_813625 [Galerina marginata CBS 339.88]|uniref:Uncharacterized protein n=1 Tax=Galerina marginata (strain CBS 339.88) TaxID=685588 RepID=A0A067SJ39_GALM3|nr:hypothetical protein GALMADRAFT_813625 [Galerina marginata CBS 339.88]